MPLGDQVSAVVDGSGRVARRSVVTAGVVAFMASPRVRSEPHRLYAVLRNQEPVHESPFGVWMLSRHEDVAHAVRSPVMSSDERKADQEWLMSRWPVKLLLRAKPIHSGDGGSRQLMERLMLFMDPPDHTRLRSLVSKAFTPRAIARLEGRVRSIVDEMLDELVPRGRMELMHELAYPFPARVICELLGVPAEDHTLIVKHAPVVAGRIDPGPMRGADDVRAADRSAAELTEYIDGLIESRRRAPGEDLLSALLAAEEAGDRLTHDELVATLILLLIAGHETTANLIGNGLLALLRHPDQMDRLRDDPAHAVEELLRYDGPIQITQRVTLTDYEVGGRVIPAGRMVMLMLAAANRDPAVFDHPDQLDLGRDPNPHLAFSGGAHFCLGAPLARMEARIALPPLVDRLRAGQPGGLALAGPPQRRDSFTIRGLTQVPLRWTETLKVGA